MPPEASPQASRPEAAASQRYANYVLGVLVLVNLFNFVDRQIVSVLLQQIKSEFAVSDAQLGILTGMAFVVVHSVVGIPIARWADVGIRKNILALGVTVWCGMTALSGAALNFGQLLFLRMGVGIGEAAGTPPSHSIISDYFPPERRARALAIYAMGLYAGIMFGYLAAGWIGEFLGWRLTFVIVGLPGLLIAALVFFTVKEPTRTTIAVAPPVREVFGYLLHRPAYLFVTIAGSAHAIAGYGVSFWAPTFLVRVHEMPYSEVGTYLGLITGGVGGLGAWVGGALSDRLGTGDARWTPWVCALAALAAIPSGAGFLFAETTRQSLACFAPLIFVIGVYTGPIFAMNQAIARPRMRATAIATHLFIVNLVGGGFGPWFIGWLNDGYQQDLGDAGIRRSLMIAIAASCIVAALAYALASRSYRRDVELALLEDGA